MSQGDVISLKLFTAALENVFKVLDRIGLGININSKYITHLRFTDDILVMADVMEDFRSRVFAIWIKLNSCQMPI